MASVTATASSDPPAAGRTRRRRFSALTQRVLAVNLFALCIVVGGVFYLDQYRRGLIEGRIEALVVQARIIASALGETAIPRDPTAPQFIDSRRLNQMIPSLVLPVGARARVFRNDGELAADSRMTAAERARIAIRELPPPEAPPAGRSFGKHLDDLLDRLLMQDLPPSVETDYRRAEYFSETVPALRGEVGAQARHDPEGGLVLNVAVPIKRFKEVLGALLLTSAAPDLETRVRETRRDILLLGLGVFGLTVLLSLYLAGTVTQPVRQLAVAADRVAAGRVTAGGGARRPGGEAELPDLSRRADEIGDLSVALRGMTGELRARVDEIESFAADVAHELKNPLSSLHSAVETFVRVEDAESRRRLRDVLLHDIERMNRLITDISAASRLDAELTRAVAAPVDIAALLETLVSVERDKAGDNGTSLRFEAAGAGAVNVRGIEDRLGQVFRNLIDNAVSFSPPGGTIRVRLEPRAGGVRATTVDDDGPGLPPGRLLAIFDRFYTERPAGEAFGMHSGLGLNIARRIVEAHRGTLHAENRPGPDGAITGARFVVWLPG